MSDPVPPGLVASLRKGVLEGWMLLGPDLTLLELRPGLPELEPGRPSPLLGRTLPALEPGLAAKPALAHYQRALATGQPQRFEATVEGADGHLLGFEVLAVPVPEGLSVVGLARPQAGPGEAVAKASPAPESFSHAITHELRAPLRHLTGFAELLAIHESPRLSDTGRRHLATLQRAAETLGAYLDELTVFNGWDQHPLRLVTVDLEALTREALANLPAEAHDPGLQWEIGPLPRVRADDRLLCQALTRLLANAVKFTRPHQDSRIKVGCREEPTEWVVYVQDNGIGFAPQHSHRLFKVFQKLHADPRFEGHGMGLAHVRRIIQRHGGRTWAHTSPQAGTTFSFSLPRGESPP